MFASLVFKFEVENMTILNSKLTIRMNTHLKPAQDQQHMLGTSS